jgi:hypothetical protein
MWITRSVYIRCYVCVWDAIVQSAEQLGTGWTVRGLNPGGGEIFRTRPDRPWGLLSLLYSANRIPFQGIKRPRRGINLPSPTSAEVKERVELYLYSFFRSSWPVLGRTSPSPVRLGATRQQKYTKIKAQTKDS